MAKNKKGNSLVGQVKLKEIKKKSLKVERSRNLARKVKQRHHGDAPFGIAAASTSTRTITTSTTDADTGSDVESDSDGFKEVPKTSKAGSSVDTLVRLKRSRVSWYCY